MTHEPISDKSSIHATPEEVDQIHAEVIDRLRSHQNFLVIMLAPDKEETHVFHSCDGQHITHMWEAIETFREVLARQMLKMALDILEREGDENGNG